MKPAVFIISYWGNGPNREKRKQNHLLQLEWLNSVAPTWPIHVYAQDYHAEDFQPNVTYHINNGSVIKAGPARNELLKIFYSSDIDAGLFLDDDSVLMHYGDEFPFQDDRTAFEIIAKQWDQFKQIDLWAPLNPINKPFRQTWKDEQSVMTENLVFNKVSLLKGSFFWLKNLNKYYGKELWFDSQFDVMEDLEFSWQLVYHGFTSYELQNVVLREFSAGGSTQFTKTNRREILDAWLPKLAEKWQEHGIKYITKDKPILSKKDFFKKHWHAPKRITVRKNADDLFNIG